MHVASLFLQTPTGGLSFRQLLLSGNKEAELLQSPVKCEYSIQEKSALNLR